VGVGSVRQRLASLPQGWWACRGLGSSFSLEAAFWRIPIPDSIGGIVWHLQRFQLV
jgi:hypothetical protein